MLIVNVLSVVLIVPLLPLMFILAPEGTEFLQGTSMLPLILGIFAYVLLHEAVHGVCFWFFSRSKPTFG